MSPHVSMLPTVPGLLFWLWLVVMTPHFVASNDAFQETGIFSFMFLQHILTNLDVLFLLSLCEHSWHLRGANFEVFQRFHHCFQQVEANIQFHTQFPGHNLSIAWMSWLSCSSFCSVLAGHGCLERGLFFMLLLVCWNAPLNTSLCSHLLFDLHKRSSSVDECQ